MKYKLNKENYFVCKTNRFNYEFNNYANIVGAINLNIPISIGELLKHVTNAETAFEQLMIRIGIIIVMIAIITGTYIIASTLYKMTSDSPNERTGLAKKFFAGSALIVFGLTIGVIVVTIYTSARGQ